MRSERKWMRKLEANYEVSTAWDLKELGINLNKVYDWHVKYDKLYIQYNEGGAWYDYAPNMYEGYNSDFKYPVSYKLDDEDYDYFDWKADNEYEEDLNYG